MNLRERTLRELFETLMGIEKGECKYYPCHFEGQDCSFCFCPFHPCLIYETGGELKGNAIWSCMKCDLIHKPDVVQEIKSILSGYPFQTLADENWVFFNEILQEIVFGQIKGKYIGKAYSVYEIDDEEECYLVILNGFEIVDIIREKCKELKEKEGVLIPLF